MQRQKLRALIASTRNGDMLPLVPLNFPEPGWGREFDDEARRQLRHPQLFARFCADSLPKIPKKVALRNGPAFVRKSCPGGGCTR